MNHAPAGGSGTGEGGAAGGSAEARVKSLGLAIPTGSKPAGAYIPVKQSGALVFVAGQIPMVDGKALALGVVPTAVSVELARQCARQCVLNALGALRAHLGTLDRVVSVVRVGVFVACENGFTEQPKVANGASELLVEVFGEAGKHARAAVGSNALPLGVPVEVEMVVEVRGE